MKTKSFVLLLIAGLALTATAKERTAAQQEAIARQALAKGAATARGTQPALRLLRATSAISVFGYDHGGFAVVSTDDAFPAVLGYSDSEFCPEDNPALAWWMDEMQRSLSQRLELGLGAAPTAYEGEPVECFVTALWGQGVPYNFLCPRIDSQNAPAGCLATALAQVVYHFRYPESIDGTAIYSRSDFIDEIQTHINTTYRWDDMREKYNQPFYSEAVKTPVAELVRDCGYVCGMSYALSGSGARIYNAAIGMSRLMGYEARQLDFAVRNYYSDEEWMGKIYEELAAGRPIIYGASQAEGGGHAFVFCGVDADGLVYVNWGWDGKANGYFDVADLSPTGILGTNTTRHYYNSHQMLYGITPDATASVAPHGQSMWTLPEDGIYRLTGNERGVTLAAVTLCDMHWHGFTGQLGLWLHADDGQDYFLVLEDLSQGTAAEMLQAIDYAATTFDLTELPAGHYRACMASLAPEDETFQPVRCVGGAYYYDVTKAPDGSAIVGQAKEWPSGIKTPAVAAEGVARYDLLGRRTGSRHQGLMIERRSDGQVRKVMK
ncbi:MAG: C10 family peptidase [Prevotella sp.]|nr:C10 family peptidase [Prevotella sp.]